MKKVSEREAARLLDIPLDRLRHEVNVGRLEAFGPRHKRRFDLDELDRWWSLFVSRPWMKGPVK